MYTDRIYTRTIEIAFYSCSRMLHVSVSVSFTVSVSSMYAMFLFFFSFGYLGIVSIVLLGIAADNDCSHTRILISLIVPKNPKGFESLFHSSQFTNNISIWIHYFSCCCLVFISSHFLPLSTFDGKFSACAFPKKTFFTFPDTWERQEFRVIIGQQRKLGQKWNFPTLDKLKFSIFHNVFIYTVFFCHWW